MSKLIEILKEVLDIQRKQNESMASMHKRIRVLEQDYMNRLEEQRLNTLHLEDDESEIRGY
jgi:hypothetical protein